MQRGKVNFLIDGQWGSTGKGKLAGYLATHHEIGVVIGNFMPNAGHTFIEDSGRKIVSKMIPTAAVNKDAEVYLSPVSLIDVKRLLEEVEIFGCADRLFIHPHAGIVESIHKSREQSDNTANQISSTLQGCGAAMSDKVQRACKTAKDEPELERWIKDWTPHLQMHLEYGRTALFESAQGFDLSLNWGVKYPFVTSRDITIGSMINDAGICLQKVGDIYGSIRCHPIRVGNVKDKDGNITGFSGPHYTDQEELSWDEITKTCGAPQDIVERTTVTGKIRRVFSFSTMQLLRFLNHCGPTHMFVNFIEYLNWRDHGIKEYSLLSAEAKSFIVMMNSVVRPFGCKIAYVGTGEKNGDMVEMNHVA